MRSMNTFEGPLVAFRQVVSADIAMIESKRQQRLESYNASVREIVGSYKEQSGYKMGPMMNDQVIRRHFASVMGVVVERQLMMLVAPMLLTVQAIDRSLHHVTIFASPSCNGRERYAPKPRGTMPHQIRVGAERAADESHYAN